MKRKRKKLIKRFSFVSLPVAIPFKIKKVIQTIVTPKNVLNYDNVRQITTCNNNRKLYQRGRKFTLIYIYILGKLGLNEISNWECRNLKTVKHIIKVCPKSCFEDSLKKLQAAKRTALSE